MTDIDLDELLAEARRQVSAWEEKFGSDDRGVTWASLAGRLADALEAVKRERDEALAVIEQVRLLADALVQARDERDASHDPRRDSRQ